MTPYSIQPGDLILIKGYGFLSFAVVGIGDFLAQLGPS